jgi:hypothetical protein
MRLGSGAAVAAVLSFGLLSFGLAAPSNAQSIAPRCVEDSRACMIQAATSYLEGIVRHDGSKVLFAPNVVRTEQGHDTGKGEAVLRAALGRMPPMLGYANTRFVIDERSHQLVYFTLLRLEIAGGPPGNPPPPGASAPGPVTVHLAERFRIEHGLITEIEAIFHNQTGTSDGLSGWPDSPD